MREIRGYKAMIRWLTVVFFLLVPGILEKMWAQEEDVLKKLLDTRIDTAAKYTQSISEAPASVTIITSEDIDRFGYRTIDEALMQVKGFYITNDRNYVYAGVRGFSRPSDYNIRILILINGNSTTDNIWGSSDIGNELGLHIDAVERIEIVRGPASALYGTNAMLAVINIITKDGKMADGLKISVEPGSYGKIQGGICFGKEMKNGLDVLVSGFIGDIKGQDLYFKEFDAPETNNGIARGLDWERYYGIFAGFKYKDFSLQGRIGSRKKGIPTASYITAFNDNRCKTLDARSFIEFKYNGKIGYSKKIMVRGYFNDYLYRSSFPTDYPDYKALWEDKSIGRWLGIETQFNWDIRPDNHLVAGVEYRNHFRAAYRTWDESGTLFDRDFPYREYAFYIQDEYQLLRNVAFTFGLRYDKHSDWGASLTPRTALVYNPSGSTTIKFLYGNAYRAPSIYEIHYEAEDEAKGNPSLEPEKINTFEAVLEQWIGKHIFAALSLYSFEMKGLIEQREDPADGLMQFQNIEKVRGTGIEMGLEARLKNGFKGYMNCTYQRSKDALLEQRLSNSPSFIFKLGVSVPLCKHFFASLETFYESGRKTVYDTWTKPYLLTNIHLFSRELFKRLSVSLQVRNLFDVKYWTPGGFEHVQPALLQNGRNFSLKVEYIINK